MNKNSKIVLLVLMAAVTLIGCSNSESRQIQVTATARVAAAPEVVSFDFVIEERGKQLVQMKALVDKKTSNLVKLCKRLGIDKKDLTAAEVSIQPQYHYNSGRFTGYHVSRNVSAKLYDLSKYSKVIDGAVRSGITTIQNISLELKGESRLEDKALVKAVISGKKKAELLATTNGVHLGKVLNVIEINSNVAQSHYELKMKRSSNASAADFAAEVFEPGQLTVLKTVRLTFAIN